MQTLLDQEVAAHEIDTLVNRLHYLIVFEPFKPPILNVTFTTVKDLYSLVASSPSILDRVNK